MSMIETYNLTKKFNGITAVNNLDIKVEEGEIFGLLGPNGAGKTTTLSMLCTIVKPTSGRALVNGFDILRQADDVRKSIGIVFQDPSLDNRLTARENLETHAALYDVPEEIAENKIDELLDLVKLSERSNDLVKTFSGGMKRRLEIARGLIHMPKVLFLDEPTLGLDPQTREHIWNYIEKVCDEEKITVIITTHYMDEAERLCNRIGIIDFGKIVAIGKPEEMIDNIGEEIVTLKIDDINKGDKFRALDFVKNIIVSSVINLVVENGSESIPKIFEFANKNNIKILSLETHNPTLNDVFLHYVGRDIRDEKGSGKDTMRLRLRMRGRI